MDVERNKGNGPADLRGVYDRYISQIYSLCKRLLDPAGGAEDAAVDAFVRYGREIPQIMDYAAAFLRLRDLAIDAAITRLKLRERVDRRVALGPQCPAEAAGGSTGLKLSIELLDRLSARLPDLLRAVFVLRDREGISTREVASYLNMTESEVTRLTGGARLELRRLSLNYNGEKA